MSLRLHWPQILAARRQVRAEGVRNEAVTRIQGVPMMLLCRTLVAVAFLFSGTGAWGALASQQVKTGTLDLTGATI